MVPGVSARVAGVAARGPGLPHLLHLPHHLPVHGEVLTADTTVTTFIF